MEWIRIPFPRWTRSLGWLASFWHLGNIGNLGTGNCSPPNFWAEILPKMFGREGHGHSPVPGETPFPRCCHFHSSFTFHFLSSIVHWFSIRYSPFLLCIYFPFRTLSIASPAASCQVFEHRLAEAINRLRETLDELTVQKKGIKCRGGQGRAGNFPGGWAMNG